MSLPDRAMVFAAGFGTRMGARTRDLPKPLLPVAGRTMLDHALDRLAAGGVTRAVVNTHYHAELIAAAVEGRRAPEVVLSHEPQILETGGGLQAALPHLGPRVLSVNPDAIWAGAADPLATLAAGWREGMEALLLLVPRDRARAYTRAGDFDLDSDGRLIRRGTAASAPYVYSGWQILRTGRLAARAPGAFSLNEIWNAMAADGGLHGAVCDHDWVDVGTPEGLDAAEALLAEGVD